MADTIPGSVQNVLDSFAADYAKWGYRAWCYDYPGNDVYAGTRGYYWCAMQVTRNLRGANFDLAKSVPQFAYCPAVENYMAASPDWITHPWWEAQAGDVILYKKNGLAYHIGMVAGRPVGSNLPTIEGDTSNPALHSNGSQSVGGCLAYRTRYMPNYTTAGYSVHIFRHTYLGKSGAAAVDANAQAALANVLQVGSTGERVAHLQAGLNKVFPAYTDGGLTVDGDFGPLTAAAVKKFQAAAHIAVDGVVGADTAAHLAHYGIKL